MKKLPSSLLLFAVLLQADFQASTWKYRRPVSLQPGAAIEVLTLDRETYVHSQAGLADLRVMRGADEVPYVLEKMSGLHEFHEIASGVQDQGVTAEGDLELIVDVENDRTGSVRRHNGIRLSTSRTNYRQRVAIATSDDRRTWTRVRDDGYIFDFSQDERQVSVRDVSYPASTRRYVRATIYGWNDPKAVIDCSVALEEDTQPARDGTAVLTNIDAHQDDKTQSTLFNWDLGEAGVPYDEMTLDVSTPTFQRAVVLETSKDGKEWGVAGQGVISRFRGRMPVTFDFPESHERYLRLRVYNRDDRPISLHLAMLSVVASVVKFKAESAGSYWLYYGNPEAHAPAYDLRDLLAHQAPRPETRVAAGAEEANPDYREKPAPSKPWTEQHPGILYIALAIAVACMGVVTVRFLKKAGSEGT